MISESSRTMTSQIYQMTALVFGGVVFIQKSVR